MSEFLRVWCAGRVVGEVHASRFPELMSLPQMNARRSEDGTETIYYMTDPSRLELQQVQQIIDAGQNPDWAAPRPAADHGRTLALTLTDEYLAEVEGTLDKVRQVFDCDGDAGVGFDLQHARECPAYGWKALPGTCGCGLISTLDEIQHALATLRTAREQVRTLREAT